MWPLLPVSIALAGGHHGGLPLAQIPGLTDPACTTPELGWAGTLPGGWLRVYVGGTEAEAEVWYDAAVGALSLPPGTDPGLGDEWAGAGPFFGFRDGNVAVLVRVEVDARARATALHALLAPDAPSPVGRVISAGGYWTVDAPWAVAIHAEGGEAPALQPNTWRTPPRAVHALDPLGRVVRLTP